MKLPAAARSLSAVAFLSLSFVPTSIAQKAVWNNSKRLSQKASKTVGTLKQWKKHLQEWGLDSNYHHSLSLAGKLNTNGWSLGLIYQQPVGTDYERRKGKHAGQSKYWSLSFSEVKHEKQVKQQKKNTAYPELGSSSPFVYGKINNLYLLQLGYGREQLLLPGVLEGNMSVSFRYGGGFSLAMLKPYYLKLLYMDYAHGGQAHLQEERYSEDNSELFLNSNRIFGGSKWSNGLNEIRYVPGAFVEGAFVIESSKQKSFFSQIITLGGQFSFYTKSLPIMADRKAYVYIGELFVGLSLGKRW